MKHYKIGEISKLYNISTDILRHYEKEGLLLPEKKGENGYRYYSNKQIWKLGTIRALRQLGIGLEEIKEYLGERNLESTSKLLNFQLEVVEKKLKELEVTKNLLKRKKKFLEKELDGKADLEFGVIRRQVLPERRCYKKYKSVVTDWEIDFELKKLKYHADTSEREHFADSRVGAIVDMEGYSLGLYNVFEGTFIIDSVGDDILRRGEYLLLKFSGSYNESYKYYEQLKEYMREHNLYVDQEIIEIYKIDIHETDNEEEFITEIQVPVKIID